MTAFRQMKLGALVEGAFGVSALLLLTRLQLTYVPADPTDMEPGLRPSDPREHLLLSGVYLLTAIFLLPVARRAVRLLGHNKLLWVLVSLTTLSALWSVAPQTAFARSVAVLGTSLFGLYLAARYRAAEQLDLLAAMIAVAAVASFAAVALSPSYGVGGQGAFGVAWRGIFPHKNALGCVMALGILVLLMRIIGHRCGALGWGTLGMAVILLTLSRSKTALMVLLATLGAFVLYRSLGRHYGRTLFWLLVAILPLGLVVTWGLCNVDVATSLLGKDATLTGRTGIWSAALKMFAQRPWLGYGFRSFWLGETGPSSAVCKSIDFIPAHGHNGLLDVALELGLVGVVVFLSVVALYFARGLAQVGAARGPIDFWPLTYFTFFLLDNFTESLILKPNSLYWALFVAAVLSIANPPTTAEPAPAELSREPGP